MDLFVFNTEARLYSFMNLFILHNLVSNSSVLFRCMSHLGINSVVPQPNHRQTVG